VKTVFDSTVLIAHLRGDNRATALLIARRREERLVSVVSRVEIEGGMRSAERADVARLFGVVTMVPVSDAIAQRAGAHLRAHRRSHQGIDLADYLIAATVDVHDAVLATLNVKHFPMFKGLRPAY
jgi:predicted nucleic acid-binding protein